MSIFQDLFSKKCTDKNNVLLGQSGTKKDRVGNWGLIVEQKVLIRL